MLGRSRHVPSCCSASYRSLRPSAPQGTDAKKSPDGPEGGQHGATLRAHRRGRAPSPSHPTIAGPRYVSPLTERFARTLLCHPRIPEMPMTRAKRFSRGLSPRRRPGHRPPWRPRIQRSPRICRWVSCLGSVQAWQEPVPERDGDGPADHRRHWWSGSRRPLRRPSFGAGQRIVRLRPRKAVAQN